MKRLALNFVFASAIILVTACGGGDSDFSGTFVGEESANRGGQPIASQAWVTLAQNGSTVSGTYITSGQFGQSSGQVSGTAQGNMVQINVTFNSGSSVCQNLVGTGTQSNRTITGTLAGCGSTVTFTLRRNQ